MENDIIKRLTENQRIFFNTLKNYIDDEIYFYGSIRRFDYLPGKSDIDVDLFTDNEDSLIYKLCNLLNLKKDEFRRIIYKIDNKIINGFKCKYKDLGKNLNIELSIYNNKIRNDVVNQHNKANALPFITLWFLYILKYFYYELSLISDVSYAKTKHFLLHMSSDRNFILL